MIQQLEETNDTSTTVQLSPDRRNLSPLALLVTNFNNYRYIIVYDVKIPKVRIERANYRNIYIYYIRRSTYDFIFLYNKSNKFYRFMIRNDTTTSRFTLINDFYDTKVRDYFIFEEFKFIHKDHYVMNTEDMDVVDVVKRLDA